MTKDCREVHWTVTSQIHAGAVTALADLTEVLIDVPHEQWRLVGGLGVAVLCGTNPAVAAPTRLTPDADAGISVVAEYAQLLEDGLVARGYAKVMGSRFLRHVPGTQHPLVVDTLVPARFPSTISARKDRTVGPITASPAPGLKLALSRPPVIVDVHATMPDGARVKLVVPVPDEVALLVMKLALASIRSSPEDDADVGFLLECLAGRDPLPAWPADQDATAAASHALTHFVRLKGKGSNAFDPQRRVELRSTLARLVGPAID